MHAKSAIAALASVAGIVNAGGFSVDQVDTGKKVLRSGPNALREAYAKYGIVAPPTVVDAASALQSGSVTAAPQQYDSAYLSPVQIGTPKKTLMLDFDTGSSDLWVFCGLQPASQKTGHSIYLPRKSSSAKREAGETWSISYADTSGASGIIFADTVVIGGVTATSQAVECATSVSTSFASNTNTDGLVGLGASSRNTARPNKVKTFFETVENSLPQKVFAASLKAGKPGSYDFGFVNAAKYSGAITYVPIQQSAQGTGLYEFISSGYSVGSTNYKTNIDAIADTGTSLMLLPQAIVANYYSKVQGAQDNSQVGGYIFPCSSTLPTFAITIGGAKHVVPGSYLNYAPIGTANGQAYCYGGLQADTGLPFGILGDVFLKSVYAVFDVGNNRIGFATQK